MHMEEEKISREFSQAVMESLENLAFVEAIPLDADTSLLPEDAAPRPRTNVAWALTPFVRPLVGNIVLLMPPELGQMLTEIMFGAMGDGEIVDDVMLDAIAETSNVIAGRVMNGLIGDNAEFELGLPQRGLGESDEDVPLPDAPSYRLDYAIEGYTFTVVLGGRDFQPGRVSK